MGDRWSAIVQGRKCGDLDSSALHQLAKIMVTSFAKMFYKKVYIEEELTQKSQQVSDSYQATALQ